MKLLAVLFLLAPLADAEDLWVDPVAGDDAHSGSGPADALRTVTRAITLLGPASAAGIDRVRLQPGIYGPAENGETFPLRLRDRLQLEGVEGPASVVFCGGPTLVLVHANAVGATSLETRVARVTLFTSAIGVEVRSNRSERVGLTLEDVVIEGCAIGVDIALDNRALDVGYSAVHLERVELRDSVLIGLRCVNRGTADVAVELWDSVIEGTAGWGLTMENVEQAQGRLGLTRCRIQGNGNSGVTVTETRADQSVVEVTDSLIAGNGAHGLFSFGACTVRRSTLADNPWGGVTGCATIVDSIVYGNGDDVASCAVISSSIIGDGDGAGVDGNLAGDPGFLGPGDYRLRFASPAVDSAVGGAGERDLRGHPRDVDGDQDLDPRPDRGALELRVLDGPAVAVVGDTIDLSVHGRAAGFALVRVSLSGLLDSPRSTPFGTSWLPGSAAMVGVVRTTRGAASVLPWTVPPFGGALGRSVGVQALVRTFAATSGGAWSNPLEVEVLL